MEHKADATDRLRREKRWEAASAFREERRRQLRAEGLTRADAKEGAWKSMIETFRPACAHALKTGIRTEAESDSLAGVFNSLRDDPEPTPFFLIDGTVDAEFLGGCGSFVSAMLDRWAETNRVSVSPGASAILQAKIVGIVLADRRQVAR